MATSATKTATPLMVPPMMAPVLSIPELDPGAGWTTWLPEEAAVPAVVEEVDVVDVVELELEVELLLVVEEDDEEDDEDDVVDEVDDVDVVDPLVVPDVVVESVVDVVVSEVVPALVKLWVPVLGSMLVGSLRVDGLAVKLTLRLGMDKDGLDVSPVATSATVVARSLAVPQPNCE